MAQPPVSQQIQQLEKELGVQLFERNTRSVSLTKAGQALHGPAQKVLNDLDLAKRAAMFGSSGITGRVSLGFASASSRRVLPLITRAVKGSEPGIDLALQGQTYGGAVVNQILSGSLDMGLARLPVRDPSIDWHIIDFETLVAALPEDHPLAAKPELEVADLAGEPFVTFPGTQGSTVRDATALIALQAGFSPRIVQEAPDSYTILSLVAAGVGITVTVSSVQHIQMPGLCYRAFPHLYRKWPLCWRGTERTRILPCTLSWPLPGSSCPHPSPSRYSSSGSPKLPRNGRINPDRTH
ncbi:LysR family transcriptional regulator [Rhodococcus sp. 14C212]|uniref:LysR family transcriptional regulator n=1 Tax=Rhodococcus sp. 14C212 TaxID=2711209 RepID=UPI001981CD86|nr:LysR family transcriptional regulator [Rhodococcus sp. 14C212]